MSLGLQVSDRSAILGALNNISQNWQSRQGGGDRSAITGGLATYRNAALDQAYAQLAKQREAAYQANLASQQQAEQKAIAEQPAVAPTQPTYTPPVYEQAATSPEAPPAAPTFNLPVASPVNDALNAISSKASQLWQAGKGVPVLGGAEALAEQYGPSVGMGAGGGLLLGGPGGAALGGVMGGLMATPPGQSVQQNISVPVAGYGEATGILPSYKNANPIPAMQEAYGQAISGDILGRPRLNSRTVTTRSAARSGQSGWASASRRPPLPG